jgi:hypothetical protein
VRRSGVRWLREDGHLCQAGEVVAFCNFGLDPIGPRGTTATPFWDEIRDVQVALATPVAGRLTRAPDSSRGGFLDLLDHFLGWDPDYAIGQIETAPDQPAGDGELRLLMMAGRRAGALAEVRAGLGTGWHERSRAWRADGEGPVGTVVSLGICEMGGVIKGDRIPFQDLLDAVSGPAQVVYVPDNPLVHSCQVLIEQIRRTPADREAIASDLARSLLGGAITPQPADWIFAGAVLNSLGRSPANERYTVLGRDGLRQAGPPDAIVLSLNAEPPATLRHRRLGYAFHYHDYRLWDAGDAFRAWVRAEFEPVPRDLGEIQADYRTLIDLIRQDAPRTRILIGNMMSTSGFDDVQDYAAFDAPLEATLDAVRCKTLNLMLHDLARERDIDTIDADAIAAELGGQRSMPDGIHQNGEMQAALRSEILRILGARGAPGFSPRLEQA